MIENRFTIYSTEGKARRGSYKTLHGEFSTPNFMPVGTVGSVKGVDTERLKEVGTEITLVNTYHLWLRPGESTVQSLGGIHKFMAWAGPILSDSGGFQVFSLKGLRTLTEQGVEFRSHIDGSKRFLSPEDAIRIQETLGVDIAMVLDECPHGEVTIEDARRSLELTLRWAKRSLEARKNSNTSIFGITQGGMFQELRTEAAEKLSTLPFDGYAVGGLSVGEKKSQMYEVLEYHPAQLPHDRIRYLMGVGTPQDIVKAVHSGIDLFDCVMPTRAGRFGRAFINGEEPYINIKNAGHALQQIPLDGSCSCLCCRNYSRGYLHHLFKSGEMLGPQLLSIHNLRHYLSLMARIREAIEKAQFESLYAAEMSRWRAFEGSELTLP